MLGLRLGRVASLVACAAAVWIAGSASLSAGWSQGGFGDAKTQALWRCANAVALRNRLPLAAVSVRGVLPMEGGYAVSLYSLGSYGCTVEPGGYISELIRLYAGDFPARYAVQCRFACPVPFGQPY